jgi:hypothetical protein
VFFYVNAEYKEVCILEWEAQFSDESKRNGDYEKVKKWFSLANYLLEPQD